MVCVSADSIDDLMRDVQEQLICEGTHIRPSRGDAIELSGVRLELRDPLARLSRSQARGKVFSCLGEFLWYLAGSDKLDYIQHYIPQYHEEADAHGRISGAYGTRLFGVEQRLMGAIDTLRQKPDSRRAVVPLLEVADLAQGRTDIPCTTTLQFLLRNDAVDMIVYMRSNDVYRGLPHDVFSFTMLQELTARTLGAQLGRYVHMVGSLHLYQSDMEQIEAYFDEGYSGAQSMPPMPHDDLWPTIGRLVAAEAKIRIGDTVDLRSFTEPYWADIVRLLLIYALSKSNPDHPDLQEHRRSMTSDIYDVLLNDRLGVPER